MAITYPTTLDSLSHATCGDNRNPKDVINDLMDISTALEAKVGVNSSAVNTSLDFKTSEIIGGDTAVGKSATQTLTNKTLTLPKINENVAVTSTSTELNLLDGVTATTTELNYVDVATPGMAEATKALITDASKDINLGTGDITATIGTFTSLSAPFPPGILINGKISITVASNNKTVAIKTIAGTDPSATDPVYINIGGTIRTITSALSVTTNAGTNWFAAGSAEMATKEIDYFVYLGYNATDGVTLGHARIPYANLYSDFSTTNTAETYCAISSIAHAAAGDNYVVIGRFAATLSAGAGYTWSVPTFTAANLIQKPIYETRILNWQPAYTANGSMTYTSVTTTVASYQIRNKFIEITVDNTGTIGGTPNNQLYYTVPFTGSTASNAYGTYTFVVSGGAYVAGRIYQNTTSQWRAVKADLSNFANPGGMIGVAIYPIAI